MWCPLVEVSEMSEFCYHSKVKQHSASTMVTDSQSPIRRRIILLPRRMSESSVDTILQSETQPSNKVSQVPQSFQEMYLVITKFQVFHLL
jgi:hypothetical protein